MYELIKKLVKTPSVSGREKRISDVIIKEISPFVDDIKVDALGNIIAFKKGKENASKLMYAAHMDEIGFIVNYIEDNGFLRVSHIGGINYIAAAYTKVVFENGVRGVLVPESNVPAKEFTPEKFYVDIGAKNKKDAEKHVKIGDYLVLEGNITKLYNKKICGRPIDDRIGCAALIECARRVRDNFNDLYFVFTVQEEVGIRGAGSAAFSVSPDFAIACDVTGTGDTIGAKHMAVKLSDGVAIKIKDSSVLCNYPFTNKLKAIAKENSIKYQLEILEAGGTDTSGIQMSKTGVAVGALSIPMRYIHSGVETVSLDDVEECIKLLVLTANEDFKK